MLASPKNARTQEPAKRTVTNIACTVSVQAQPQRYVADQVLSLELSGSKVSLVVKGALSH